MSFEEIAVRFIGAVNRLADAIEKARSVETKVVESAPEPVAEFVPETPAEPEQQETRRRPGRPRLERPNGHDTTAGPTHEDALAIATEVAAKYDKAVVAQLVRTHTGSGMKIADLPKNKLQAFIASCEVMLSGRGEPATEDL